MGAHEPRPEGSAGLKAGPAAASEFLIPCGKFSQARKLDVPKRSVGVMEYWSFQHSITPILHYSGSTIFHGVKMSEARPLARVMLFVSIGNLTLPRLTPSFR